MPSECTASGPGVWTSSPWGPLSAPPVRRVKFLPLGSGLFSSLDGPGVETSGFSGPDFVFVPLPSCYVGVGEHGLQCGPTVVRRLGSAQGVGGDRHRSCRNKWPPTPEKTPTWTSQADRLSSDDRRHPGHGDGRTVCRCHGGRPSYRTLSFDVQNQQRSTCS